MGFIGFLTVEIFLIRHGSYILKFAFQGDLESTIEDSKDFFDAAIKLYGLYLIAGTIPVCVWLLANALIALGAPPYMSVDDELDRIKSYLLSVLTTPGLGMCGVFWSSRNHWACVSPIAEEWVVTAWERNEVCLEGGYL